MSTITQKMYLCLSPNYDKPRIYDIDMCGGDSGYISLGTVNVTVDVPDVDVDAVSKRIEALESVKKKLDSEYADKLGQVDTKIQELRARTAQEES